MIVDQQWQEIQAFVSQIRENKTDLDKAKIVLFGAGRFSSAAFERLRGNYDIYAFADNNPELWGTQYEGLPVLEPKTLKHGTEGTIVILTVTGHHEPAIIHQLEALGVPHMTYMELVLSRKLEQFQYVYEQLLDDEFSKQTYASIILSYLKHDMSYLKEIFVPDQYFALPDFHISQPGTVFVDCGAYVGDTVEGFVNHCGGVFKRIYAFEPTQRSCSAMQNRKERLVREWALQDDQIVIERKIVDASNGAVSFSDTGHDDKSNHILKNSTGSGGEVTAVALDKYFENSEDQPTFIKADIEGAEQDMIRGAERIISQQRPLLAICLYHRIEDLFEIPIRLKKLNPQYKFAVRHHMPNYHETVLYCY